VELMTQRQDFNRQRDSGSKRRVERLKSRDNDGQQVRSACSSMDRNINGCSAYGLFSSDTQVSPLHRSNDADSENIR